MNEATKAEAPKGATAVAAATPVAPKAPTESPLQAEARALRKQLGHIVVELQKGDSPMRPLGAALLTAHLGLEMGAVRAAKLTGPEVQAYAALFRRNYPAAWGAAASSNVVGFVRFAKAYGLRDKSEPSPTMIAEYQAAMSQLAA